MQKIFSAIIVAVMMAAGLVAASGSTAGAAECPYGGCFATSTRIDTPEGVTRGERARIRVKVTSAGNGAPQGQVTITVRRRTGGYFFRDSKNYDGGWVRFRTTRLPRGKFIVRAAFDRQPGSVWKDSDNVNTFRVTRR